MFDSPPPHGLRRHAGLISNALKLVDEARQQLTVDSAFKGCNSAPCAERPASLHPVLEQLATLLHDLQARTADEQNHLEGLYDIDYDSDGVTEGGAEQLSRGHLRRDDVDADYQDLHDKFIRVAAENKLLHQTNQQLWDTVAHLQQCLSPYSSSSRELPPIASTSGSSSNSGSRRTPAARIGVCDSHFDYEEQIRRIEKAKADARQSKRQHQKIVKGADYKTSPAAKVSYDQRAMVAARGSTAKLYNMRAAAEAAKSKQRQEPIAECEAGEETEDDAAVTLTFPDDEVLQLRLDALATDNATAKDSLLKAHEVLVQQKQDFDRLVAESAAAAADALERKKQYDHVVECATLDKAVHDKLIVDSAALKGQFDALLVDNLTANEEAAQQKRDFDRLVVDSALVKQDLAQAAANAAESKKQFDHVVESAAVDKACHDKLLVDSAALKGQFDFLVVEQASVNDALAKASHDAVAHKQQYDSFMASATADKACHDKLIVDSAALKGQYDTLVVGTAAVTMALAQAAAQAVESKKQFDLVVESAAADKACHDKLLVDSAALKGQFDFLVVEQASAYDALAKAAADASETKAIHDKLVVDSAALKGQFDHLVLEQASVIEALAKASNDSALQKQEYDQLVLESAAVKQSSAKATADAVENKKQFDHMCEAAAADKAVHDKLILDSAADKAAHDKLIVDSAADKAVHDKLVVDAAADKAVHDKLVIDSAALKGQFDSLVVEQATLNSALSKASDDAATAKQEYDDLVTESAAVKRRLDQAAADAVENKRHFDDMVVAAAADKACHDKLIVDNAEQKACHDKLVVDNAEQKAHHDQLVADTAALKGQYDTLVVDNAAVINALRKSTADAALQKHEYDQLVIESAAVKQQLDQASADAIESKRHYDVMFESAAADKAVHDKLVIDSAALKGQFDKVNEDAALQKKVFDDLVQESAAAAVENKKQYDVVVEAAAADKAAHDKLIVDSSADKAVHDKLVVDSAALKGQFDTLVVDTAAAQEGAATQKREYDTLVTEALLVKKTLAKAAADAKASKAEYDSVVSAAAAVKASHDKLMVDSAQDKASHDKLIIDSQSLKGQFDSLVVQNESVINALSKANEDAVLQKEQFDTMAMESAAAAAELVTLQDEREALLQQQMVLKTELASMLKSYQPSIRIDTGTPAEKIMQIMTELVEGRLPGIEDILLVRSAILESRDLYQPMHLGRQLVGDGNYMDKDVTLSLMAQLGTQADSVTGGMTLADFCHSTSGSKKSKSVCSTWSNSSYRSMDYVASAFLTLSGALSAIMAPNGQDDQDLPTMSPGMLSKRDTMGRDSRFGTWDSDASRQFDYLADSMMPPPPIIEDVERVLAKVEDWQFDAFELQDVTQGHPLSTLGYFLFFKSGLIDKFGLKPTVLARALRSLEDGYSITAPYHSSTHAADVLQSVHNIIHRGGLMPGYVDPLTLMACYLAAIMHDYEHEGLTNDFLINSGSSLAVLYNDKAPLENHHCAAAFSLMKQPGCDFMSHMVKADRDKLRKLVIDLILGTDMKQHFTILGQFKTLQRIGNLDSHVTPSIISISDCNEAHDDCALDRKIVVPLDDAERVISLQMMLKCADLGHVASQLPVHLRWVACLEEEFFKQGDKEKRMGLPISPLFDRTKQGVSKSQIGFLDIVCIPLFQSFSHVFPSARPMFGYLMHNYEHWIKVKNGDDAAAAAAK